MYDRHALLAAVDLAALADELLGGSRGTGRAARWGCPNPDHPQTGRTPPVTITTNHHGEQLWHCHGCGDGGSALDLIARTHHTDIRGAFDHLASRVGQSHLPDDATRSQRPRPARPRPEPVEVVDPQPVVAGLARYADECARRLWEPAGTEVREWLTVTRGLPADVLRHNGIGADIGPRQGRPWGLAVAEGGAAVVPVHLGSAGLVYVQLRLLHPPEGRDRFLNPTGGLARNPRVGLIHPVRRTRPEVIVTEGPIDALSAAAAGYSAAAVLGAAYVHNPLTAAILSRIPARLILAFDPDHAGNLASQRLPALLAAHHRPARLLPLEAGDLNDHHRLAGLDWPTDLANRVQHAAAPSPDRTADLSAAAVGL
ncbi:MAG TPA: toprim domain-containing protein [Ilumatobacter sp.]|nr:toprim domain-containing protein [Ilumatobacter sp.]